ncbi:PAP/OAS1 substrate-binding domain-containing protein, partial [Corynespora cassiicola Philippines]
IAQIRHLDALAAEEVPKVEISLPEIEEKEVFRKHLELLCQSAVAKAFPDMVTISLVGFGSLASGFATPGSDMDLSVVPSLKHDTLAVLYEHSIKQRIPRLLEGAILEANIGGRLLTRTRVPILKVCEKPNETLFKALSDERKKWEELPEAERYIDPPPQPKSTQKPIPGAGTDTAAQTAVKSEPATGNSKETTTPSMPSPLSEPNRSVNNGENNGGTEPKERVPRSERAWAREKVLGPLDFPKDGVGIQCDINFENPLGIQNTHLLRCYSLTDPRVRPMVLFVKSWAKRRKINSSYSGTLSSYGWVLMVLHYLVNVAHPPVCPNLQLCAQQPRNLEGLEQMFQESKVGGYEVRYWKDEEEIMQAAYVGRLTQNRQSVGALLRGFFSYYAAVSPGYVYGARPPSFHWTTEALSLRTPNGIRLKQEKGWTGAKTTISGGKEVRHRYLLAIEDPFELDHNVARTVTHPGIVAIRDEFRRAWRILCAISRNETPSEGGLFDEI